MKKRLSLLIALVMLIAFVLPTIAACSKDEVVTKIEVVDAQTEFYLGDNNVIDYDNLKLKVTFEKGDPVTKTVKEWGATHTTADLSKEGATSYTVTYGGKSCVVNITVKVRDVQPSNQVTVTLHYNDGATADYSYSVEKGSKIQLTTPGYTNHTFGGWYTVNGGTSTEDSAWGTKWTADMSVNENLHLYARWTENLNTYIVTFDTGDPTTTTTKNVTEGDTVTLPTEPSKEDNKFGGWWTKNGTDDDWGEQWNEQKLVTENLHLYAKWIPIEYSVFVFNYLDGQTHQDNSVQIVKGETLGNKLPTPAARQGYRFDGWYTKNGTTDGQWGDKWLDTTQATESNYELFAKWTATEANVTLQYNYPAALAEQQPAAAEFKVNIGESIPADKLSVDDKTPEGYTFDGWYTTRETVSGTPDKKWNQATDKVEGALTLYARWTRITHTVTFVLGNGQSNITVENVPHNEGVGTAKWPQNPSWQDHEFLGWQDSANKPVDSGTRITDNVTFTASWKETATVTFDLNDGTGTAPNAVTVDKNKALGSLPDGTGFSREGYRFDGWYTKDGKTDGWGDKWQETTPVTQNTTLYAKWVKQVKVTFNLNYDGAQGTPDPVTVDENTSLGSQFPTPPTRATSGNTQYTFEGWFTDAQGSGEAWTKDTAVGSSDVTLYAKWDEAEDTVTYTLKYDDSTTQDGTVTAKQGGHVASWPNPSRRGYAFLGWFDAQTTGGTRYDTNTVPATESKTLYAHWQAKQKYTITLHLYTDSDQEQTITIENLGTEQLGLYDGETVTLPTAEDGRLQREHFRFDSWCKDAQCEQAQGTSVTINGANVDLYAKWVGQVTVHFVTGIPQQGAEGNEVVDITVDVNTVISSDNYPSIKDLTWEGHTFGGWYSNQTFEGENVMPYDVGNVEGEAYLYARWTAERIAVTFDHNIVKPGLETDVEYVDYGSDLTLNIHIPVREGYTFECWATNSEGTEKENIVESGLNQVLKNITTETTLYAQWTTEITVALVYGKGDLQATSFKIPNGSSLVTQYLLSNISDLLSEQLHSKNISQFDSTLEQLQDKAKQWKPYEMGIYAGDVIKDLLDAIDKMKKNDLEGATTVLTASITALLKMVSVFDTVEKGGKGLPVPEMDKVVGYDFSNWNHSISGVMVPWPVFGEDTMKTEEGKIVHDPTGGPHASTGGYDMQPVPTNTLWLYGVWTAKQNVQQHSLTFDYNYKANEQDESNVTYTDKFYQGTTIELPTPARNGYTFGGWYKDQAFSDNQKVEGSITIGETDVTLYAKWTKNETETVLVTLNYNGEVQNFVVNKGSTLNGAAQLDETLKNFLAKATTWLNGATEFSLDTQVSNDIYLVAQAQSTQGGIVMSFNAPDSYNSYKQRSANTGDDLGYFKRAGDDAQPYEVGTVNKFIFRPVVRLKPMGEGVVYDYNPTTTATVEFRKESETFENSSLKTHNLTGGDKNDWVTVDNNTYKFNENIEDGTFVRLTVSLGSKYTYPSSVKNQVVAEFKLVKGGYNVYDQRGLSVMNDNQQVVWSPLWGVEAKVVADPTNSESSDFQYKVEFTNTQNAVKLAADDKALYEYVGNVDWVILHNDIELDPTQMPQAFFWQSSDPLYYAAYQSLAGWKNQQDGLVGTLKDGDNSSQETTANYMPMYDLSPTSNEGSRKAFQVGIYANMQKGLYSTHKVSVSGNYFSLTHILERGGRKLQNYVDWQTSTKVGDPITHWSVFQLITNKNHNGIGAQSTNRGTEKNPFTVKNIAMKGSTPQKDYYDQGKTVYFAPAGIMLANTYASINFDNINANNFFTVIVGDNYGEKEATDKDEGFKTAFTVKNSKLYDVYSNMIYTWRGHIHVSDSEFVGSGGPLFIMCDADRPEQEEIVDDKNGPTLDVSGNCRLEAYATGAESWYDANNAAALVTTMRGAVDTGSFNKLGKTIRWVKDGSKMRPFQGDNADGGKNQYINIIAVMICSPGSLMSGGKSGSDPFMPAVEGITSFNDATINGNQSKANATFAMHSDIIRNVKSTASTYGQAQGKTGSAAWPIVAQMGDKYFAADLNGTLDILDGLFGANGSSAFADANASDYGNIVCVRLSAAVLTNTSVAPYFGVVLGIGDYGDEG